MGERVDCAQGFTNRAAFFWSEHMTKTLSIGQYKGARMPTLTYADRLKIREWYEVRMPKILASTGWGIDKWTYPWFSKMSPIEKIVWEECVTAGLVMYPEFPVGKCWVDFGNPRFKVAIECDGAAYHDQKLDQRRDAVLARRHGWSVYRIRGSVISRRPCPPPECVCYDAIECTCARRLFAEGDSLEAFVIRIRDEVSKKAQ